MRRKPVQKIVSVLLLLLILLPVLPCEVVFAEENAYYGEAYDDLQKEEHRIAYQLMEEGIAGLSPIIELKGTVDINYKEMMKVIRAVCVDHPQYFWFLEEGRFTYDTKSGGNYIVSFEPKYVLDGERVNAGSQALIDAVYIFHTKVQQILAGIPINYTTDYEIALYLHDYLAENVTYTLEGDHPSAYAALIHGEAACYGYSKAYQCLLNAAGVRARTITGDSLDENGEPTGHAWNQVWLDGDCFYVDVTWDDFESVIMHEYFAMSLEEISRDHIAEPEFILPECDHNPIRYHATSKGSGVANISTFTTAQQAAACFRMVSLEGKKAVFVCEIRFSGGDFFDWFRQRYADLLSWLGMSNRTEAYYYQQNDVYYLEMIDSAYVSELPKIKKITLAQASVTLPYPGAQFQLQPKVSCDMVWWPDLVYTSSDPAVLTVDANGLVTSVSVGTATVTATSLDGSVSMECVFVVDPAPEHVHTMRLFAKKQATCTQDGHETYYLCTGCGRRFADEAGMVEYTKVGDFVLPASGHVAVSWVTRFDFHKQQCKCGENIGPEKEKHYDNDGDALCDACGAEMEAMLPMDPEPSPDNEFRGGWIIALVVAIPLGIVAFFVIRRIRRGY